MILPWIEVGRRQNPEEHQRNIKVYVSEKNEFLIMSFLLFIELKLLLFAKKAYFNFSENYVHGYLKSGFKIH